MRKMSAFLELPGEPAFREVQVILTGKRRAVIENYRNIQSYTREEILILTPSGRLVIRGKNLGPLLISLLQRNAFDLPADT